MNNIFYNPKYRTKQIFELNGAPLDEPGPNEVYYWITSANSKLYANFKAYGIQGVKTVEIGAQASGGSGSGGKYVSGASVSGSVVTFSYSDSSTPFTVDLSPMLPEEEFTSGYKEKLDAMPSAFTPPPQAISFTSANSTGVSWSGNAATFTHSMNCLPVVTVYDNGRNVVMADVSAATSTTFKVDFGSRAAVSGTWTCVVAYGSEWQ